MEVNLLLTFFWANEIWDADEVIDRDFAIPDYCFSRIRFKFPTRAIAKENYPPRMIFISSTHFIIAAWVFSRTVCMRNGSHFLALYDIQC